MSVEVNSQLSCRREFQLLRVRGHSRHAPSPPSLCATDPQKHEITPNERPPETHLRIEKVRFHFSHFATTSRVSGIPPRDLIVSN